MSRDSFPLKDGRRLLALWTAVCFYHTPLAFGPPSGLYCTLSRNITTTSAAVAVLSPRLSFPYCMSLPRRGSAVKSLAGTYKELPSPLSSLRIKLEKCTFLPSLSASSLPIIDQASNFPPFDRYALSCSILLRPVPNSATISLANSNN